MRNMKLENKYALIGTTLIDGNGGTPVKDSVIVVKNGIIEEVGNRKSVSLEDNIQKVDIPEYYLMPGLIDCHVHFTGARGNDPLFFNGVIEPMSLRAMRTVADVRNVLSAGFTTARDLGSLEALYLKKVIEEGTIAGPRLVASGRGLCRTGGGADLRRDIYGLPDKHIRESLSFGEICDGVEEVRKAVRKMIGMGADCIKCYASGAEIWKNDRKEDQHFTLDEMKTIVEEAHMCNMKVAAHAEGFSGVKIAVETGVDTIEHGDELDEDICKEMIRKNIILVPTISVYYVGSWAAWEVQQKSFKIAHRTGVKIALGSDAFCEPVTPYGKFNIGEIRKLVDWGMSPMEAVVAATKTGAEACGIGDKVGTLEKGKIADILLVKGNPLDNIDILLKKENIEYIIKEGKIVIQRH